MNRSFLHPEIHEEHDKVEVHFLIYFGNSKNNLKRFWIISEETKDILILDRDKVVHVRFRSFLCAFKELNIIMHLML